VFASNRSGKYQIYSMNADGTGVKEITRGNEAHLASWGSHP
jgi:Tol biopolymer transport system component